MMSFRPAARSSSFGLVSRSEPRMEGNSTMMRFSVCASAVCFFSSRSTGKERDTESGNDYFGARYYASIMGRWLSPDMPFADQDTENPRSWNLYSYVRNNPLNHIDDSGMLTIIIGGTGYNPHDSVSRSL